MKKFILIFCLLLSTINLGAYTYPASFQELISQLEADDQRIEVVLVDGIKLTGMILVAQTDYMVFKTDDEDVFIILYSAIKQVSFL